MKSIKMRCPAPVLNPSNRISIGLSFGNGCNTAFLVLVNFGLREGSRLKDGVKDSDAIALTDGPVGTPPCRIFVAITALGAPNGLWIPAAAGITAGVCCHNGVGESKGLWIPAAARIAMAPPGPLMCMKISYFHGNDSGVGAAIAMMA